MTAIGWNRLRREPYRLLFPLGIAFGCLGVTHWLLYALGASDASPHYHAAMQLGAYVSCFIVGFLWTALPRMSGAPPASHLELAGALSLLAAQAVLLARHEPLAAQLCHAGLLVLLAVFVLRRMAGRRVPSPGPTEFIWIPLSVGFGLLGSAALAAGALQAVPSWVAASGRLMSQQGFILALVVGVAGFLSPRLMGRARLITPPGLSPERARLARRRRLLSHAGAACLLGASFLLEGRGAVRAGYLLRAAVVSVELGWRSRWWAPPVIKDLYARLLWVSLWCVIAGLWAVACWPAHRAGMLHLVFIGGFSLMIFAVGTMVVLSHAGRADALQRPLWVLRVVAVGVALATAARLLANVWPLHYFLLLAIAACAWLSAGMSWLLFVLPWVMRTAPEDALERAHEQAKKRLAC